MILDSISPPVALALGLAAVLVLWLLFGGMPRTKPHEWQEFSAFLPRPLITGEVARGTLMRRRIDGEWQYRLPTPQESADLFARDAW